MTAIFTAFLLCLFPVMTRGQNSDNELENSVIKVAYFDMGDYYKIGQDGMVESYDKAYLDKISEYTGLQFEYIDCQTWDNALVMLNEHKVDLVGTMQYTFERTQQYAMCSESYGITVAELAALPDSGYVYEDYDAINNASIGYVYDYVRLNELNELFESKGLKPEMKGYASQEKLHLALIDGEIDMAAANSHTFSTDWVIVDKFDYSQFYFASWKGNDKLIEQLDDAIMQINLYEGDFDDTTLKSYFPNIVNAPFSKKKLNVLTRKKNTQYILIQLPHH